MRAHLLLPLASLLLLSACHMAVGKLQEADIQADDFPSALAAEYQEFSASEVELGHFYAANRFAEKGLDALSGKEVLPDELDDRLTSESHKKIKDARSQLMKLLIPSVKTAIPQDLARAQLMFDCWQHQEVAAKHDSNALLEDTLCESGFSDAVDSVIDTASKEDLLAKDFRKELEFPAYRTSLTRQHQEMIHRIIRIIDYYEGDQYFLQLRVYTGKKASQRRLTSARLRNVKQAFIEAGVPEGQIRVQQDGSARAVILSRDNVAVDTKVVTVTLHINDDDES